MSHIVKIPTATVSLYLPTYKEAVEYAKKVGGVLQPGGTDETKDRIDNARAEDSSQEWY